MVSQDARVPVAHLSSSAAQIISAESPRAPTPPANVLHGVVPAVGTSTSSVPPPSQVNLSTKGVRAHGAAPLGHGPSSATRTCASSAAHPCRGSNSAMGARAPDAALFNHGTGACDSHAPPRHAPRSKKAPAVTTRRSHTRAGSSPLLPYREEAVGLRWGKAHPNTFTPRHFARLDPVFPRDCRGRSILFSIKEGSTSLATSSPSSKRTNGNEPPRARNILTPARAPLLKTPKGPAGPALSLGTLAHVHQAASAPEVHERYPTLRNGPVVTPRPPA